MQILEALKYRGQGTVDGEVVIGDGQMTNITRRCTTRQFDASRYVAKYLLTLMQKQTTCLSKRNLPGGALE